MQHEFGFPDPSAPVDIRQARLPHWRMRGAIYFVTFRLADSMPESKLREWRLERPDLRPKPFDRNGPSTDVDRWLDCGHGCCALAIPECREIVESTIRHFHGSRYLLDEHVVAANHVHALVMPIEPWSLSKILHSWKSYSAHAIRSHLGDRLPGLVERVWQKESFDHIVRSPEALEQFRHYIRGHDRGAPRIR
jgi:REP element-mobilizing transposase RayT